MTMRYTVIDREGTVIDRHLSLAEAANEILSYDGSEWRVDGEAVGGWRLSTCKPCAGEPWTATVIFSLEPAFSDATEDIFNKVIKANWRGQPEAMLDSDYDNYLEDGASFW